MARGSDRRRKSFQTRVGGKRPSARRDALLLLLILGGLLLLFYWKNLVGYPFDRTFFWEDFLEQNYPYRAFHAEEIRRGVFPDWNPYQFGGMPFSADIQAAAYYPPNFLLPLFVKDGRLAPLWVELGSVLHALLGGFFLYLFVRRRTACSYAGALAGISWAFSGFFVVRMIHTNVLFVVAWAPLVLLLLSIAVDRRSVAPAILGGILFGFSILGGSPQYSLYIVLLLSFYGLYEAIRPGTRNDGAAHRARPIVYTLLLLLIGVGCSTVQLLPTAELSALSVRTEMTYEKSVECSFGPASLSTLLIPSLYGRTTGNDREGYWGPGFYYYSWELTAYSGVAVLLLSAIPLVYGPRDRLVLFLALLALFGVLAGLGGNGPLHPLLYKVLPGYDRFRCPTRALFLTGISLSVLAGLGARRVIDPPERSRWKGRIFAAVSLLLIVAGTVGFLAARQQLAGVAGGVAAARGAALLRAYLLFLGVGVLGSAVILYWTRGRRGLSRGIRVCLLLLVVGELFLCGYGFNDSTLDPDPYYRGNKELIRFLRDESDGGLYRVKTRVTRGAYQGMVCPRNQGSINRIPSVDGYNQLKLQRYEDVQSDRVVPFERTIDLLGVRIFTAYDRNAGGFRLFRNEDCLPKVLFMGAAEACEPGDPLLERLGDPSLDLRELVLLEKEEGWEPVGGGKGEARVLRWGANEIVTEVECDGPGYLLLNEVHYPAWKAYVDGEERDARPADHTLRAVALDAGKHEVVWKYSSPARRAGGWISLAVIAFAAIFLLHRRRGGAFSFRQLLADVVSERRGDRET